MGSWNLDRITRLKLIEHTMTSFVRMAVCVKCGHAAQLPVAALIRPVISWVEKRPTQRIRDELIAKFGCNEASMGDSVTQHVSH